MAANKLTKDDVKEIQRLLREGVDSKELAKRYGVDRSTIYNRPKYGLKAQKIPVELKNKVIQAINDGYTKAEAAQMYDLNIGTVTFFTRGINGNHRQGNHIIRLNGIKLLNRLMNDGYLISDFNVPMVRNLQQKFPLTRCARFKDKTFFYLPGREEETAEAFFREKPDRIISYTAIEEISVLLVIKISSKNKARLLQQYRGKHIQYWRSRRLIQRSLDDYIDDNPFKENAEPGFRLFPKNGE